ncbi:MAG TPA: phosphatase PAP2 family protein [Gemmatimonadaceae bacterium]|jgi:undecaprenyl-diphosphatase
MKPLAEHTPPPPRRLIARLDPRAYLTLHVIIGLTVCVLTCWLFAAILDSVEEKDVLVHRDLALASWFHLNGTPLGDRFFAIVSLCGSPVAMAILFFAAVAYLWKRHHPTLLTAWVLSFVGGTLLDFAMKEIIRRPRPEFAALFLHGNSWSFPSGHSMGSLIGYSMLAYTIIHLRPVQSTGARVAIWAGAAIMIALVGYSRLYLAVHFLSDVVAGYTLGVLWLAVCFTGLHLVNRRAELRRAPAP